MQQRPGRSWARPRALRFCLLFLLVSPVLGEGLNATRAVHNPEMEMDGPNTSSSDMLFRRLLQQTRQSLGSHLGSILSMVRGPGQDWIGSLDTRKGSRSTRLFVLLVWCHSVLVVMLERSSQRFLFDLTTQSNRDASSVCPSVSYRAWPRRLSGFRVPFSTFCDGKCSQPFFRHRRRVSR